MIMKHPAHPKAKNEYQGTSETPKLSMSVKEQHKADMKAFAVRLRGLFLDRGMEPSW